eukprot:10829054-Lingulodinium_polyedra.AAC.1
MPTLNEKASHRGAPPGERGCLETRGAPNRLMEGLVDGLAAGLMEGLVDRLAEGFMDGLEEDLPDGWKDGCMYRWTDGWIDCIGAC